MTFLDHCDGRIVLSSPRTFCIIMSSINLLLRLVCRRNLSGRARAAIAAAAHQSNQCSVIA